jgi:ribosomal-protein-alanine N-acetyltransferase
VQLQQLTAGHLAAVLDFELANRDYFALTVPDRGDEFFASYPARHAALLAMQAAGTDYFHVLADERGTIAGRVNLTDVANGEAELGFRIGRDFAGRGLATDGVRQVIRLATEVYALRRLRAGAMATNHASRAVLMRNDFVFARETGQDNQAEHHFTLELAPAMTQP